MSDTSNDGAPNNTGDNQNQSIDDNLENMTPATVEPAAGEEDIEPAAGEDKKESSSTQKSEIAVDDVALDSELETQELASVQLSEAEEVEEDPSELNNDSEIYDNGSRFFTDFNITNEDDADISVSFDNDALSRFISSSNVRSYNKVLQEEEEAQLLDEEDNDEVSGLNADLTQAQLLDPAVQNLDSSKTRTTSEPTNNTNDPDIEPTTDTNPEPDTEPNTDPEPDTEPNTDPEPEPENQAPTAAGDNSLITEDIPAILNLLGNDTDVDGDALTITALGSAAHGTVVLSSGGQVFYTPEANYNGSDSFTYTISDGNGGTSTATVNLTIMAVNDGPQIVSASFNTAENAANGSVVGQVSASDVDGDTLTYSITGGNDDGVFAIDAATGQITIADNSNLDFETTTAYDLKVTASDGTASAETTVSIGVSDISETIAPVANDDQGDVTEDKSITLNLLKNDTDGDGGKATITSLGAPEHGTVEQNGKGTVTYTPDANYNGSDSFTYTISDGNGGTSTATVTLNVQAVNDAPTMVTAMFDIAENAANGTVVGQVSASDVDGDTLTYSITGGNSDGIFSIDAATGQITIADNSNLNFETTSSYSLNVTASDGSASVETTVSIGVSDIFENTAPVAADDSANGTEDTSVTLNVLTNDSDADGDNLTITAVSAAAHGTLVNNGDGTVTYTPDADYNGSDSFTYTISDGNGGTSTATVNLNVVAVNDAPTMVTATFSIAENATNGTIVGQIIASDIDGDSLTYSITGGNDNGVFSINPITGQIVITDNSNLDFENTTAYDLKVTASDGSASAETTVSIGVSDIFENTAPVAADDSANGDEDTAVTLNVLANDSDVDGHNLTITAVSAAAHGTLVNNGDGTVTYTPDANYNGSDSFTYTVSDGNGGESTATVNLNVAAVNDAPTMVTAAFSVAEDAANGTVVGQVAASDVDGDTLTYSITGGNADGVFEIDSATGQIKIADNSNLDFETTTAYDLKVTASDGTTSVETNVAVGVTDVDDTPVIDPETDPDLGDNEILVGNTEELVATLKAATGGETILLKDGHYDAISMDKLLFSSNVTITSLNDKSDVVFDSMVFVRTENLTISDITIDNSENYNASPVALLNFSNSSNITVDGIDLNYTPGEIGQGTDRAVRIYSSDNVTIKNSNLEGEISQFGLPEDTVPGSPEHTTMQIIDRPWGNAIGANGSNITIENNDISGFNKGVSVGGEGIQILNNEIHDLRSTPLNGAPTADVLVEGNYFHSFSPWAFGGLGDHGDLIHFWTRTSDYQTEPSTNIIIRDNLFSEGHGTDALLGIYLDDNTNDLGFENVLIENNVIHNGDAQSIRFEDVNGAIVRNNTFLPTQSGEPSIVLADHNQNISFENNLFTSFAYSLLNNPDSGNDPDSITFDGNIFVQGTDPTGENYVGNLFIDPLATLVNATDIIAIPGTAADGVGASLTQFTVPVGSTIGYISIDAGAQLDRANVEFNADHLFNADGQIDLSGATVAWDFGDGNTGTGLNASNEYNGAGFFTATATITTADGETYSVDKTVYIETPIALDIDFEDGAVDNSAIVNPTIMNGNVTFEDTGVTGKALRLSADGYVSFDNSGELYNNDELTVALNFKKDEGSEDSGGAIVYFPGGFYMSLEANAISVGGNSNEGPKFDFRYTDASMNNAEWHQVVVTASQVTGKAVLYVDGVAVSEMDGLVDIIKDGGWDFSLGNPFRENFTDGLIDDVQFLRGAMDADAVADKYAELQALLPDVEPVNTDPEAANDAANVSEDTAVTLNVLANDSDADGDNLTITAVSAAAHGTLVNNGDGTVTYTPDANYNGSDSFTYTVSDGNGGTSTATVTMSVTAVNDAPTMVVAQFDVAENAANGTVVGQVAASDVDGDALTYSITGGNSDGIFSINAATGQITIADNSNLDFETTTAYDLKVTASDGTASVETNVAVGVTDVDDTPVIDPDLGDNEILVSNTAELQAALDSATGGETILLKAGDYGDFNMIHMDFASKVTIKSLDADNMAHFNKVGVIDSSNIRLESLDISLTPSEDTTILTRALYIAQYSSDIEVVNSKISGHLAINGYPEDSMVLHESGNVLGLPAGTPMQLHNVTNITIEGNEFAYGHRGATFGSVDGLIFKDNNVHDVRTSFISGGNVTNVTVDGNTMSGATPWHGPDTTIGDHSGMIRFWTQSVTPDFVGENIIITNNILMEGAGDPNYMFLEDNSGSGYKNVVFDNNVIHNGHSMGILVENADGLTVTNNTLLQSSLDPEFEGYFGLGSRAPGITIYADNTNVLVENNITGSITVYPEDMDLSNIVVRNNMLVQSTNPDAENYVGDLFINALQLEILPEEVALLTVRPDSILAGSNMGSSLLQPSADQVVTFVSETNGSGMNMMTHEFSVDNFYNGDGKVDITGATVEWDFGDGSTGEGLTVQHTFETPDFHAVSAKVTLASGEVVIINKTIQTQTPVALDVDFEDGPIDLSDIVNDAYIRGSVSYEDTGVTGKALRLDDSSSYLGFTYNNEIYGNDELSFAMNFKKDAGSENATGQLLYFTGGLFISLNNAGGLDVGFDNGETSKQISLKNIGLDDSDWHQVVLTVAEDTGMATIYVDGEKEQSIAIDGAAQRVDGSWGVHLGYPFGGRSFTDGVMDDVQFLRGALDADAVAEKYAELQDLLPDVEPVNTDPTAADDAANVAEDDSVTLNVLTNDSDADGDNLTITAVSAAAHGTLVNNGDGTVTYTPDANYNGSDSFTYTVSDGRGGESTATVTMNVTAVNDAPTMVVAQFDVAEDAANGTVVGQVSASDVDGDTLTYSITGGNSDGIFAINASTGQITIADNSNLDFETTTAYDLKVTASDGSASVETSVAVGITDVNDTPVIDPEIDPDLGDNEIYVTNPDELKLALDNATGGETIILKSGDYGDFFYNYHRPDVLYVEKPPYTEEVRVVSENADDMAVFNSLYFTNTTNLTIDSVFVDFVATEETTMIDKAVTINDTNTSFKMINSVLEGDIARWGQDPITTQPGEQDMSGINGYPIGRAATLAGKDIVFEGNTIYNFASGVGIGNIDGLEFNNNEIFNLRRSPLVGGGDVNNVTVDGNHFHSSTPWNYGGNGDHADYIHLWTANVEDGPMDNMIFTNNYFEAGDGIGLIGIFLQDKSGEGFTNVVIDNNVIHTEHSQGIYLTGVHGGVITNNTLLQSDGGYSEQTGILLSQANDNLYIDGNLMSREITGLDDDNDLDTITITDNNVVVQRLDPNGENYYGDIFVDGLKENGTLFTLTGLPGTVADGVGSSLTQFDTTPTTILGFVTHATGQGLDRQTVEFDANNMYGPEGKLDLTGATVVWNFGDGTTAEGLNVSHTFEHGDVYEVTATVTLPGDVVLNLEKTVDISSLTALDVTFEDGATDISDITNTVTVNGSVSYEETGVTGKALRLDNADANVVYYRNHEIYGNEELSFSLNFKKDAGAENATGQLVYFIGGLFISLNSSGGLDVSSTSEDGTTKLNTGDLGLNDSDWHQLTVTVSEITGKATLYLDGAEVQTADLIGSAQRTDGSWGLTIGNPFGGRSFANGLIDDVQFLRGAMGADAVAEKYNQLLDALGEDPVIIEPEIDPEPVNTDPTAANDAANVSEDTAVTLNVLANDSDADGDNLTITAVSAAAHGTLVNNGDGTVTYTPDANYNGSDSFTYTVSDGNGGTSTATVTMSVTAVNDAPTMVVAQFDVAEDAANGTVVGQVAASDVDGDTLTYSITGGNSDGIFAIDAATGEIKIADNTSLDFETTTAYDLKVTASDGSASVETSVAVGVTDVNDTPVIEPEIDPDLGDNEILVSNAEELMAALESATGGETILLKAGDYGDIGIIRTHFDEKVTIKSLDPDNMAELNTLTILESSNMRFDNLDVTKAPSVDTLPFSRVLFIGQNSSDIEVANSKISGHLAINGYDQDSMELHESGNVLGLPTGTPLATLNATNITIENNEIFNGNRGAAFGYTDGLIFKNNEIHSVRKSFMSGGNVSNVEVDGNTMSGSTPWHGPNTTIGDHSGMIRFWTQSSTPGFVSENISITNNILMEGAGDPNYMFLEDNSGGGYINVVFDNNVIHNGQTGGFSSENTDGLQITNNTLLQSSLDPDFEGFFGYGSKAPGVRIGADNKNVLVENNVLGSITVDDDNPNAGTITVQNNMIVQSTNPAGENYTGDLFINALQLEILPSEVALLTVRPDSVLAGSNLGSSLLQPAADQVVTFVSETNGSGLDMMTHEFSADNFYNGDGKVDITGATVEWDFGDGHTAEGLTAEHTFETADFHAISAKVTLASGEIVIINKTIQTQTPVALDVDFEDGPTDHSDIINGAQITGSVSYEDTGVTGKAVRLDDSASNIKFERNDEIYGNEELSFSLNFKKDAGAENATGQLVYFAGGLFINLNSSGGLDVSSTNEGGSTKLNTGDLGLNDSEWHQITVTVSEITGKATLYVDGAEVKTADLTGTAQRADGSWGIHLGNPFGKGSFTDGLIDDVQFLRGAMDSDAVAEKYNQLLDALGEDPVVVDPVNTNPTASNDSGNTTEDTAVTLNILANDSDADGDNLTITAVSAAAHGTLVNNGDGTVTYTPDANYNGSDSFTYTVSDGNGGTSTATVSLSVAAVNDAPTMVTATFSVAENATNGAVVGQVAASDVDGDTLTYSITGGNDDGVFSINASTGQITIADNSNLDFETTTAYDLKVTASDGTTSVETNVAVGITDVNDTPVIEPEIDPDLGDNEIYVTNPDELKLALDNATGGETIILKSGNYGDFYYNYHRPGVLYQEKDPYTSEVRVVSEDPDNMAVFNTMKFSYTTNLTIDSVFVDFVATEETTMITKAVTIDATNTNLKMINSVLEGDIARWGQDPITTQPGEQDLTGINGYPIARAMSIAGKDIVFEGNTVTNFASGVGIGNIDGLQFNNNEIFGLRRSPLVGGGEVNNVTVDGNHFHSSNPWGLGGQGDHADYIHLWTSDVEDGPMDNMVFINNYFETGDGIGLIGIFLQDKVGTGFTNVIIDNNVIHSEQSAGIYLTGTHGGVITNNTLLQSDGDYGDQVGILMSKNNSDLFVDGNLMSRPVIGLHEENGNDMSTITVTDNNVIVQRLDPDGENYYGNLFVDGLKEDGTLYTLTGIPGTVTDGIGSSLTQFDTTPDTPMGFVLHATGHGMERQVVEFDANHIYGPEGQMDLTGATVVWDFGDGTTGEGLNVSHTFEHGDVYEVTATVTLPGGDVVNLGKTVDVSSLVALDATFEGEAADLSDLANTVIVNGSVSYEETGVTGKALRLDNADANVVFYSNHEIYGNDELSFSMNFQKDVGAEDATGQLVYFTGGLFINLNSSGGLDVSSTSNDGTTKLNTGDLGLNDSEWHQLTVTVSEITGKATLFVDGTEVQSADIAGAAQKTEGSWGLTIGNPFGGRSFADGLIDDIQFLRGAMDADAVADKYSYLQAQLANDPVLLNLDVDADGITEASSYSTGITVNNPDQAVVELDTGGYAYHLTNDTLIEFSRRSDSNHLYNNDKMSLSFGLKRDSAADGGGYILNLVSGYSLTMNDAGNLQFDFYNMDEEKFTLTSNIAISDTDWHHVTVSYDSNSETASFFIDGQQAGTTTMTGLTDVKESWGITLGDTLHDNFEGLIKDFEMQGVAMDESAAANKYADLLSSVSVGGLVNSFESAAQAMDDSISMDLSDMSLQAQFNTVKHGTVLNDTIDGTSGDEIIIAGDGDDTISGGGGNDLLYGGDGADEFVFETVADGEMSAIADFNASEGDVIDISGVLEDYSPVDDAINDFIQFTRVDDNTVISVDSNGGGDDFVEAVVVLNNSDLDLNTMINNGELLT